MSSLFFFLLHRRGEANIPFSHDLYDPAHPTRHHLARQSLVYIGTCLVFFSLFFFSFFLFRTGEKEMLDDYLFCGVLLPLPCFVVHDTPPLPPPLSEYA